MRIQHNIMAMNAYRNYNNNASALSKNLEKLSSGYKINRAGDDAAGLAISEKMRAQITGLNAAQKNVKDGISLVKTAEGAMQEIQDMLNRMDYLATQSANGTYDNEVDRAALQKEVEQLKSEINRIADSANFNGIKLLDGSLDNGATKAVEAQSGNFDIPAVGKLQDDLGVSTITHTSVAAAGLTTFGVELGDLTFSNQTGESMTIDIGGHKLKIDAGAVGTATAGTEASATDIMNALLNATSSTANVTAVGSNISITAAGKMTLDGVNFNVTANSTNTGLVFTQDDDSAGANTNAKLQFNGDMAVSVTGDVKTAGYVSGVYTAGTGTAANDGKIEVKVTVPNSAGDGNETLTFTANNVAGTSNTAALITALKATSTTNANGDAVKLEDLYEIKEGDTANTISLTLKDGKEGKVDSFTLTADTGVTGQTIAAGGAVVEGGYAKGTYNTQTTQTTPSAAGAAKNLASTVITIDADKMTNGSSVTFGETKYTFTTEDGDAAKTVANAENKVYVGDLDLSTEAGLKVAIDRLSVVAKDNAVWSVGYAGEGGKVTVTEKANDQGVGWMDQNPANKKLFNLTTVDGIKKSLGFDTAEKAAYAGDPTKGLQLQIGDTSDDYNQLKVVVGDMHTKAMGIADLDISTAESASGAIQTIKDAINYVSSVRVDLGATQNRLEHTQNNLSVMAENIQDAESTIRDTDVAEEMMSYVKNNILVQSAQAMLAQANQVPQGVLQLLG